MKSRKLLVGTVAAIAMLILILDGRCALYGAAEGLELCIRTVIPSLFPFFILSIGLVGSWTGLTIVPLRLLGKILHIPSGVESILIPGFLGGYPVGAQVIAECYRRKQITADTAERLSTFCNNAGPAFIFGIISQFFPGMKYCWILWGVHIVSAVLVALVLPKAKQCKPSTMSVKAMRLSEIMNRALRATATVCGWVILFRVILTFLDRWLLWLLPLPLRPLVIGIIELTNGCCALADTPQLGLRMIIASGILALGGFSVWIQTASVLSGLSVKTFIFGKILHGVFSVIVMCIIQCLLPSEFRYVPEFLAVIIAAAVIVFVSFRLFFGIRCSIPTETVV